jgi:hexosaminidase
MPGHAAAANRAYPEFSGGGSEAYPEFTFHPAKEGTYGYLTDIIREISELFPASDIHLGGDEVHFGNQQWATDKQVQSLMKKMNLSDLKAVEKYFINRMADSVKSLQRKMLGWDEIVDSEVDRENAIVMWWRHDKPEQLKKAFENKYNVILCPRIPLYFDFVQHESHKWGRRWRGAFADIEKVYAFPPDTLPGFNEFNDQILGIQANVWTETIVDDRRLDFMIYPRISALSEAAWTNAGNKNYEDFLERLKFMLLFYEVNGIYYFNPFEPGLSPEAEGI